MDGIESEFPVKKLQWLYTLGHSNHSLDRFVDLLKLHRIHEVVDIRSVPFSRFYSWFNRERLSCSLRENDLEYSFMGDSLGGRITDPLCYKSQSLPKRKAQIAELINYDELLRRSWFKEGIHRLEVKVQAHFTVIICSEEDPRRCHRNLLVGRRMTELGYLVGHIRSDGRVESRMHDGQIPIFE